MWVLSAHRNLPLVLQFLLSADAITLLQYQVQSTLVSNIRTFKPKLQEKSFGGPLGIISVLSDLLTVVGGEE